MGSCRPDSRSRRVTSKPSMSGSMTSRTTRSGLRSDALMMAERPSLATDTSNPAKRSEASAMAGSAVTRESVERIPGSLLGVARTRSPLTPLGGGKRASEDGEVVGVDDPVCVALLGEEPLAVGGEVGVHRVAGDHRVEVRGAAVTLGPEHAAKALGLLLARAERPGH